MIKTKKDYKYYCYCDRIALGRERKRPKILGDEIWKYEILLRKAKNYYERI